MHHAGDAEPCTRPEHDLRPVGLRLAAADRVQHVVAERRERQRERLEIVDDHHVVDAEPVHHCPRPDHPVGVGEVDLVSLDGAGDGNDGGARHDAGHGEYAFLHCRFDVRKIAGVDRIERLRFRMGVAQQREARVRPADVADQYRKRHWNDCCGWNHGAEPGGFVRVDRADIRTVSGRPVRC